MKIRISTLFTFFLFLTTTLSAQKAKVSVVEEKTFDGLTIKLVKTNQNDYYINFNFKGGMTCSRNYIADFIDAIVEADKRKGFHVFLRSSDKKKSIMVRHTKKSNYIGIGYIYEFHSGSETRIKRESSQDVINYLYKLNRKLSCS